MTAPQPAPSRREAAGSSGDRRFALQGAIAVAALLAIAWLLLRTAPTSDVKARRDALFARIERLQRMALVMPAGAGGAPVEPFFVDRFEVTVGEFLQFVAESGYRPVDPAGYLRGVCRDPDALTDAEARRPVRSISALDAEAFARHAGKRLPTPEQWERSAESFQSASLDQPADMSLFEMNAFETGLGGPARVGSFEGGRTESEESVYPPVYDLLGNVAEWTRSAGDSGDSGDPRVVKGGSFNDPKRSESFRVRATLREEAGNRSFAIGMRCVIDDAEAEVRALLAGLRTVDEDSRARAREALIAYGRPMRRLLERVRLRDRVAVAARPADGLTRLDVVAALPDGRAVRATRPDRLQLFRAGRDAPVAELQVEARIEWLDARDADGDGESELYAFARLGGQDADDELPALELFALDAAVLDDPASRTACRPLALEPAERGWIHPLAALSERRPPSRAEREQLGRSTWALTATPIVARAIEPGVVRLARYALWRIDCAGDRLTRSWSRETGRLDRLLVDAARGELVLPAARLPAVNGGSRHDPSFLDVSILRASTGELVRQAHVACSPEGAAIVDAARRRLVAADSSGALIAIDLLLPRATIAWDAALEDSGVRWNGLLGRRDGGAIAWLEQDGPDAARLLEVRAARDGRIESIAPLDDARPGQARAFALDHGGLLLARGDGRLRGIDDRGGARTSDASIPDLEFITCDPVDGGAGGDVVLVPVFGDGHGFALVDRATLRERDRVAAPGATLLGLFATERDGRSEWLACMRGEGFLWLRTTARADDAEARALLDRLPPDR